MNCLSKGGDVFAIMPTGSSKCFIFQLCATAAMIKRVHKGQHSNNVVLVTCPLTSTIWDQELLGLDCAGIKDVKDLSNNLQAGKHKH